MADLCTTNGETTVSVYYINKQICLHFSQPVSMLALMEWQAVGIAKEILRLAGAKKIEVEA